MNLLHLKYAVEVEKTRSMNKAAENLYVGQPNLSRAIRELEESVGATLFKRTPTGMTPTPQGEDFLQYAKKILSEIEQLEGMYRTEKVQKRSFSISVPRASYIGCAFTEFAKRVDSELETELIYKETNAIRAIKNILESDYRLGIIRYRTDYEEHFSALIHEKGLKAELIQEFSYLALMSKDSPLASKAEIRPSDLADYIEIAHADPYVPSMPLIEARRAELSEFVKKRIFLFERGSQMDLLSNVPSTFMWVSPVPQRLLKLYNLVQRPGAGIQRVYKDVLIYRREYTLTELDKMFIDEVRRAIKQAGDEA